MIEVLLQKYNADTSIKYKGLIGFNMVNKTGLQILKSFDKDMYNRIL